jgi:hypothetical protein
MANFSVVSRINKVLSIREGLQALRQYVHVRINVFFYNLYNPHNTETSVSYLALRHWRVSAVFLLYPIKCNILYKYDFMIHNAIG